MHKTAEEMKEWLKRIYNVPPAEDGYRVINANDARGASQSIVEFAKLFQR